MTEHPAFRRAMSDLGDEVTAPSTDLAGAARARARFVVRRRYAVATVAGAVFLGTIAAVALPGSDAPGRIVAADPSGDPTVTTEPDPASPSASPSPAATATAGTAPTTSDPVVGVTPSPVGPSTVATGPKVTLRVVSGGRTGEVTTFEAHVTDPGGALAGANFSFGVGDPADVVEESRSWPGNATTNYGPGEIDEYPRFCGGAMSAPTDRRLTFRRTYRVPATYVAWVEVQTRSCDGIGKARDIGLGGKHTATATLRHTIGGRLWPNGPQKPTVTTANRRAHWEAREGQEVDGGPGLEVEAYDDGVVAEILVSWGDGTAAERVPFKAHEQAEGYNDCRQPAEFQMQTHHVVATPDHEYAQPGTYTATVTVTSASCDGTDRQSTTRTQALTWPPPTP